MDDNQYWVQAAPFRALASRLIDLTGLPPAEFARVAGVPEVPLVRLLHGRDGRPSRRIPRELARRLLLLDEQHLRRIARSRCA